MDPAQRTAIRENIGHDLAKGGEFLWIADYFYLRRNRSRQRDGMRDQRPSSQLEKCFVGAHARAFAAREDKGS